MSHMGTETEVENPADIVKEGQPLEVAVIEVDPVHHRIVVAITAYPDEPFDPPPPKPLPPPDDEVSGE